MAISEQAISYRAVKMILEKERDLVVLNDERNQHTLPFHVRVAAAVDFYLD